VIRVVAPCRIRQQSAMLCPAMTAHEIHNQLLELRAERALAEQTGVAHIASYMEDLERDIQRSRAAYVGAAVTEIASLRAELGGPQVG
jgi:hypothetical protein